MMRCTICDNPVIDDVFYMFDGLCIECHRAVIKDEIDQWIEKNGRNSNDDSGISGSDQGRE